MKHESFEKMDEFFMKHLGLARQKSVPPESLKNFSWEVELKIRQAAECPKPRAARFLSPIWAPVCAALILFLVLVPHFSGNFSSVHSVNVSEISSEIAAMREMGVWTEEDENAVAGPDAGLSDIELSQQI
jgi:hypothetical protein